MPISRLSAHTAEKERLSMTFQIAFTMVYLRKTPQSEQTPIFTMGEIRIRRVNIVCSDFQSGYSHEIFTRYQ